VKKIAIIGFLILAGGLIFYVLNRTSQEESPSVSSPQEESLEEEATLETKGIVHTIMKKGKKNWELRSESAKQYGKGKRIELEPVELIAYDEEEKPLLNLKAKKGRLDLNTNNVEVEGAVIITSSEGAKFTTEKLKWIAKEEKLVTDEEIEMSKDNILIRGKGLEADRNLEKIEIKENIRIEIKED
jgi:LPS export ABC transporter protein LptC